MAANSFMKIQFQNLSKEKGAVPVGRAPHLDGAKRLPLRHPHEEEPAWSHPDAPLAEQSSELGQRHGRLGAEDVKEHHHEVDASFVTRHPTEVGPESMVLEVAEPLEREQVGPRQDEREPDSERDVRGDLERHDLARSGELPVDDLGRARDAVHALHAEVGHEQGNGEQRVGTDQSGQRRIEKHLFSSSRYWITATLSPRSSSNYVFSMMLKSIILSNKNQEAASAASWECLKNFSFLLLQNMVPAQKFERGSPQ